MTFAITIGFIIGSIIVSAIMICKIIKNKRESDKAVMELLQYQKYMEEASKKVNHQ